MNWYIWIYFIILQHVLLVFWQNVRIMFPNFNINSSILHDVPLQKKKNPKPLVKYKLMWNFKISSKYLDIFWTGFLWNFTHCPTENVARHYISEILSVRSLGAHWVRSQIVHFEFHLAEVQNAYVMNQYLLDINWCCCNFHQP